MEWLILVLLIVIAYLMFLLFLSYKAIERMSSIGLPLTLWKINEVELSKEEFFTASVSLAQHSNGDDCYHEVWLKLQPYVEY